MRSGAWLFLLVLSCFLLLAASPETEQALNGYSAASSHTQREWENKFRAIPSPRTCATTCSAFPPGRTMSVRPTTRKTPNGSPAKFKEWGFGRADRDIRRALPHAKVARAWNWSSRHISPPSLQEPALPQDPTSNQQAEQLPTYNAYSIDGDVTAPLVYVNYGVPEDYEQLERMGISVKGAIVIARYGDSWRGIKPKVAAEHGAVGCLIYSDPARRRLRSRATSFRTGAWRPADGVQRGSVMDMPLYPGDPLTPGSRRDQRRQTSGRQRRADHHQDSGAADFLCRCATAAGGADRPCRSRRLARRAGRSPITSARARAKVHLKVNSNWDIKTIYDVIAKIPGATYPDEWVMRGNHHDAWVNGAEDPVSGTVA